MRIKVATLIWKDGYGGAERSIRNIAAALDPDQVDMRFYYLSGPRGLFSEEIVDMGYEVVNLYWANGFSIAGRWRLLKLLHQFDPLIVHDHIIPPLTRPVIKLACRCPILHTEHGEAMRHQAGQNSWRRLIARFDLLFCDAVLANSRASQVAVRQAYSYPESRIRVRYPGIDLQQFISTKDLNVSNARKRIGYVGRILNKHKGTDYLPRVARALLDLGHTNIEFVLAGDGPDRQEVESLCELLNVSHLFTFLGFCSDVSSVMDTFDVLLVPSRYESFGRSALEALAMGVRVVGFDEGGLDEAVGECDGAQLVPAGDVNAMARAVASILDLPQTRSRSSRAYVDEKFSLKRMASDLHQDYREYCI